MDEECPEAEGSAATDGLEEEQLETLAQNLISAFREMSTGLDKATQSVDRLLRWRRIVTVVVSAAIVVLTTAAVVGGYSIVHEAQVTACQNTYNTEFQAQYVQRAQVGQRSADALRKLIAQTLHVSSSAEYQQDVNEYLGLSNALAALPIPSPPTPNACH